jgi:membrane-associated phospholipid phosphatase
VVNPVRGRLLEAMTRFLSRLHPALLIYWAGLLATLYVFAHLAGDVYEHERFFFDAPILAWFHSMSTPFLTVLALTLSNIGSGYVLGAALLVTVLLTWRISKRSAVFFLLSFVGAVALNVTAKVFFARLRPNLFIQLMPEHDFSFPSGHIMGATAFFLALYFLSRHLFPRWQWLVASFGLLLTLGISLSRLYLQVHYPSDVLAGWALSMLWVSGVNLCYACTRS